MVVEKKAFGVTLSLVITCTQTDGVPRCLGTLRVEDALVTVNFRGRRLEYRAPTLANPRQLIAPIAEVLAVLIGLYW